MSKNRTCYLCEMTTMGYYSCQNLLNEENCPILKKHEEYVRETRYKNEKKDEVLK